MTAVYRYMLVREDLPPVSTVRYQSLNNCPPGVPSGNVADKGHLPSHEEQKKQIPCSIKHYIATTFERNMRCSVGSRVTPGTAEDMQQLFENHSSFSTRVEGLLYSLYMND